MPATDWSVALGADDGHRLQPPATTSEIDAAEVALRLAFPETLRDLYLISNGVFDEPGQWFVIWPLSELISRNQQAWSTESGERTQLIGFGDDGTGDPFCIRSNGEVLAWSPIDGQATHLAQELASFWRAWLADTLPLR
jgi:hypothetical protein